MTANEWVGLAVGLSTLGATGLVALRWVIKSYLVELKPNSGSSLKDAVSRLEAQSSRLEKRVDDLFVLITKS
jgi:hypothetical protein